jgi:hypothetical protein
MARAVSQRRWKEDAVARNRLRLIDENQAIASILLVHDDDRRGNYAFYLGAGASIGAGVPGAEEICNTIRKNLSAMRGLSGDAAEEQLWAEAELQWSRRDRRYFVCMKESYPSPAHRIDFFVRNSLVVIRHSRTTQLHC